MRTAPVYVHGVALDIGWADATVSLTDLIFRGVSAALVDAKMTMAPIDSVVLAAHDTIDGRSLTSMVTSPAAGAYLRDEIRITDDGLNAVSIAAARIEAGESEWAVVAAWGRGSEGDYQHVSRFSFDPGYGQPLGFQDLSVSALRKAAWLAAHEGAAAEYDLAAARRSARAARNPRSLKGDSRKLRLDWPLVEGDAPKLADIVATVILGREPSPIRLTGFGHGTEVVSVGERDLLGMPGLRAAVAAAAAQPVETYDLVEVDGATLADEVVALEALTLIPQGEGPACYRDHPRFNPSGGSAAAWSYPTNGLVRLVEACLQLRGEAGEGVQLTSKPKSALVTGVSAVGGQTVAAVTLETVA